MIRTALNDGDGSWINDGSGEDGNDRRNPHQHASWPRHSARSHFWPRHHRDINRGAVGRAPTTTEHVIPPQPRHHHYGPQQQHQHYQQQHYQHQPRRHPDAPTGPQQHSPPLQSLNFHHPTSGPLLYRAFPQLAQPIGAMAVFVGAPITADGHAQNPRVDHHSQERPSWRIHPTNGPPEGGAIDPRYMSEHNMHHGHSFGRDVGFGIAGADAMPATTHATNSPDTTVPANTDNTEDIDDLELGEEADHDNHDNHDDHDDRNDNETPLSEEFSQQMSSIKGAGGEPSATIAGVRTDDGHAGFHDEDDVLHGEGLKTEGGKEEKETDAVNNNNTNEPGDFVCATAPANSQKKKNVPNEVVYIGGDDDDEDEGGGAVTAGAVPPPRSAATTPDTVGGASAVSALTTPSLETETENKEDSQYSPRLPPSYDTYRTDFASQRFYAHAGGNHLPQQTAMPRLEHQQIPVYGQGQGQGQGQGHGLPVYQYGDQAHPQALHPHQHHYYSNGVPANDEGKVTETENTDSAPNNKNKKTKKNRKDGDSHNGEERDDLQDVSISSCSDNSDDKSEGDEFEDEVNTRRTITLSSMLENSSGARRIASPDSKYETYACRVDPTQSDRSTEIFLFSAARPHMRGFHFAWIGFFVAMATWFAIAPLLLEVKKSLGISKEQIWTSSIWASAGAVVFRAICGPLCDKYGARWIMGLVLISSGIPTMCTGLINSTTELSAIRAFIGVSGSAFVMCQYWTATMFTREVAGTALSLAAGWGNLGGAVTNVVMGTVLFPLFKTAYGGKTAPRSSDKAWRTACIVPGLISVLWGVITIKYSDDCPKGNYRKRRRLGLMGSVSVWRSMWAASKKTNTWLMFLQYSCCFGVEVTMTNAAALYFSSEFGLTTASAAAVASIFGWMNLFARGLGGFCSDMANVSYGMRGRLIVQMVFLFLEGTMVVVFGYSPSLGGSIASMIFFSLFVQASEGSSYAIVPYIKPTATGSVSGIIGAGGALGGVLFPILFQRLDYRDAFKIMGWCVLASSFLTPFIVIKGHEGIFRSCTRVNSELTSNSEHTDKKELEDKTTSPALVKNYVNEGVTEGKVKFEKGSTSIKEDNPSSPNTGIPNDQVEMESVSVIAENENGEGMTSIEGGRIPTR